MDSKLNPYFTLGLVVSSEFRSKLARFESKVARFEVKSKWPRTAMV